MILGIERKNLLEGYGGVSPLSLLSMDTAEVEDRQGVERIQLPGVGQGHRGRVGQSMCQVDLAERGVYASELGSRQVTMLDEGIDHSGEPLDFLAYRFGHRTQIRRGNGMRYETLLRSVAQKGGSQKEEREALER